MTDEEKMELMTRKNQIMLDYYKKLAEMRNKEIERRQEMVRNKTQNDASFCDNVDDIPIVPLGSDGQIGEQGI